MRSPILFASALMTLGAAACSEITDPKGSESPGSTRNPSTSFARAGTDLEVIASGLDNPRGLTFDERGVLYVAEAGRGGDGPCNINPGGLELCVGATGAVTRVQRGRQVRVLDNLPSYGDASETFVLGPHDVGIEGTRLLKVSIGLGDAAAARDELGPGGAHLAKLIWAFTIGIRVPLSWYPVTDLAAYEIANNPDGSVIESDPYGLLDEGARTYVVDAAGNSLLEAFGRHNTSTVAVFPERTDPETGELFQSVPTSVVRGPDGAFYVGELTGLPWPPGQARVYRVVPGDQPTVFAGGFTNIVDIAFDADGRLLVLEIATNGLASDDPLTGALKRVENDGSVTVLAQEGLVNPTGVAVGHDGALYISNYGRSPGIGQVVRLRP